MRLLTDAHSYKTQATAIKAFETFISKLNIETPRYVVVAQQDGRYTIAMISQSVNLNELFALVELSNYKFAVMG